VVCRAIGTGGDDLLEEVNCLTVPYGQYDAFVDNFRRLCMDPDLRARLRENGLRYVKEKCDWPGAIDLVEQALTGAVTVPTAPVADYAYSMDAYNDMQKVIVGWETPQAMWLGETLAELLRPDSVIDIGCGPGIYLTPFKPDARVLGVDGAPEAGQALEPWEFVRADLREDWSLERAALQRDTTRWYKDNERLTDQENMVPMQYDLSLCIETAEHLPPDRADYLVDLLAGCSDTVFFSAAQPGQGGTLHLNEQPREWWLDKFRARGFDLHPRHAWLAEQIAANPHCRRVKWLLGNAMLLGKVIHAG
jgi:SAM-dependent methyltransferase